MAEAPRRAFVCGHPVAHSRSPLIHGYWLRKYGIEGSYTKLDIVPAEFRRFVRELADSSYVGGNVTIPHKEAAFESVARRDAAAEAIGAVNTLWLENGLPIGGNTDAYGFAASLDQQLPGWRGVGTATVLGAGGAARAIVHALSEARIPDIRVVNRSRGRAQELVDRLGGATTAHDWGGLDELLADTGLLVNTTPLGMANVPFLNVDVARLPDSALVCDIVYVPLRTPLLAAAAARGLPTADGLGMLLHQAVAGFETWFGVQPMVDDTLRNMIVADLEGTH